MDEETVKKMTKRMEGWLSKREEKEVESYYECKEWICDGWKE